MRATVQLLIRRKNSEGVKAFSHFELKATVVFSGSKILKICSFIGVCVCNDLFFGKGGTGFGTSGGVAYSSCEITD